MDEDIKPHNHIPNNETKGQLSARVNQIHRRIIQHDDKDDVAAVIVRKFARSSSVDDHHDNTGNKKLGSAITVQQTILIGVGCALSSSLINHPFQVLRARFQNTVALRQQAKKQKITGTIPNVFTSDPKILFKGFSATLFGMCSLTITQSLATRLLNSDMHSNNSGILYQVAPSLLGGFASAFITTPLEGTILRQSKTTGDIGRKSNSKSGVFEMTKLFYQKYGLQRLYHGGFLIGIRTSIVGSAFSIWTPIFARKTEEYGYLSSNYSTLVAGVIVGTVSAILSQPFESIRIEQQYSSDEMRPLNIRQAVKSLIVDTEHGTNFKGLFKGGAYRIPRTAPGIVINSVVYKTLYEYFDEQNNIRGHLYHIFQRRL